MALIIYFLLLLFLKNTECLNVKKVRQNNNTSIDELPSDNEIENIFALLENGDKNLALSKQSKNLILVLGNSGSGKSTFVQWLAGDNNKLKSVSVRGLDYDDEEDGFYIIEDDNHRIGSTIMSKTIFPEMIIDNETNNVFYDCPGFSDTRSTSHDIATTYFIKKLTNHAESVKMIFIVNHSSVMTGVDRQDFMRFVKHAIEFIKNIDKFQDSIALVVTKIEKSNNKPELKIKRIVKYLEEFVTTLKDIIKQKETSEEKRIFFKKAIKFVNVLLIKHGDSYSRIGIFGRPNKPGLVSTIESMQIEKHTIKNRLLKSINFTSKIDDDFGYTLSDTSKYIITSLVNDINLNIRNNTAIIAEKLKTLKLNLQMRFSMK